MSTTGKQTTHEYLANLKRRDDGVVCPDQLYEKMNQVRPKHAKIICYHDWESASGARFVVQLLRCKKCGALRFGRVK